MVFITYSSVAYFRRTVTYFYFATAFFPTIFTAIFTACRCVFHVLFFCALPSLMSPLSKTTIFFSFLLTHLESSNISFYLFVFKYRLSFIFSPVGAYSFQMDLRKGLRPLGAREEFISDSRAVTECNHVCTLMF